MTWRYGWLDRLFKRQYVLHTTEEYSLRSYENVPVQRVRRLYTAPNGEQFFYHDGAMVFLSDNPAGVRHLTRLSSEGKLSLVEFEPRSASKKP